MQQKYNVRKINSINTNVKERERINNNNVGLKFKSRKRLTELFRSLARK